MTDDWDKLTQNEKKVAVARDIIAQVKGGCTVPIHKSYMPQAPWQNGFASRYDLTEEDALLQQYLARDCQTCAVGSVILQHLRRKVVPVKDVLAGWQKHPQYAAAAGGVFSVSEMDAIERQFEHDDDRIRGQKPAVWGADAKERLVNIMQNIVDNGGTLHPWQQTSRPAGKCGGGKRRQ